ncbi:uncharacterized protein LOC119292487 [Triticum dicoccoides]|uniref:uncharacterized protein LOC119292487 n=1 Tax=Triticum dicoccoides TaxID=85692 RepID=UPI00188F0921|nr:uncharacterized protein LOC119292487 [Triticum dicoccoides]
MAGSESESFTSRSVDSELISRGPEEEMAVRLALRRAWEEAQKVKTENLSTKVRCVLSFPIPSRRNLTAVAGESPPPTGRASPVGTTTHIGAEGNRARGQDVDRRERRGAAGAAGRREEGGACGRLADGEPTRLCHIYELQQSCAVQDLETNSLSAKRTGISGNHVFAISPRRLWEETYFQNNIFIKSDIDKHFDNKTQRLSRCESFSFPALEVLDKENPKESGHYWLMVLKIRDKRFKMLDSARTLKDKAFLSTANKIMEGIKANWEKHYNTSSVQIKDWKLQEIKCPKQDNISKVQDNREDTIQDSATFI